jgi:hypothetical protein
MTDPYIIPKQLKEENKIFDRPRIFLKDVVTCGVLLGIFLVFGGFVHSWLQVPYWIAAAGCSWFLIKPAKRSSPKKRNWEAILLLLGSDRTTYFSINHVQEEPKNADEG